jgi:hypothetical protein
MKKLKNILNELVTVDDFLKDNKKELAEVQPLHEKLTKHYSNFKDFHKEHLINYSDRSWGINNMLWKQHKGQHLTAADKYDLNYANSPKLEHLDSAMTQHKTPYKLTVYSGTKIDPREKMNKDKIVHHPAFLSASLGFRTARGFSKQDEVGDKHVMAINVPKGHPGAYISDFSHSGEEREFLLPRGSNLKYNKTEESKYEHPSFGMLKVHTHHMDLV